MDLMHKSVDIAVLIKVENKTSWLADQRCTLPLFGDINSHC